MEDSECPLCNGNTYICCYVAVATSADAKRYDTGLAITRMPERMRSPYMGNGSPLQFCLQHVCPKEYEFSNGLGTAHAPTS